MLAVIDKEFHGRVRSWYAEIGAILWILTPACTRKHQLLGQGSLGGPVAPRATDLVSKLASSEQEYLVKRRSGRLNNVSSRLRRN